ncbi:MAG: FRG domain-containing protein [Acidobacteria bacterium]|nr:FRG domain-containing protein [Acidobacteriota bacterium]
MLPRHTPLGCAEQRIVPEFRRRARHYTEDTPAQEKTLEWLSLMRHHGAPTRLLDFTKSPYVAAFFAMASAEWEHSAALWAIDRDAIVPRACDLMSGLTDCNYAICAARARSDHGSSFSEPAVFNGLIAAQPAAQVVVPVEPHRMNERMLLQQGLFLCPLSLFETFEKSLIRVLPPTRPPEPVLYKIEILAPSHRQIMRELQRMARQKKSWVDSGAGSLPNE